MVKLITFILVAFIDDLIARHQVLALRMSDCKRAVISCDVLKQLDVLRVQKNVTITNKGKVVINKTGPNMDPCGTPVVEMKGFDSIPPTCTKFSGPSLDIDD